MTIVGVISALLLIDGVVLCIVHRTTNINFEITQEVVKWLQAYREWRKRQQIITLMKEEDDPQRLARRKHRVSRRAYRHERRPYRYFAWAFWSFCALPIYCIIWILIEDEAVQEGMRLFGAFYILLMIMALVWSGLELDLRES